MSESNSTVSYRDIAGYPGYRVGDDGSVWSCLRRVGKGVFAPVGVWKPLKQNVNPVEGRRTVALCRPTDKLSGTPGHRKYKRYYVHRLVLEAFVGPCPPGLEACHGPDRDVANNKLSNLRWDTKKANAADCESHGTRAKGEKQGSSKLTESDIVAIRELCRLGMSQKKVANQFGVSQGHVSDIFTRKTWRHVA